MSKINKRWIELDTANPDSLTGADVAVSASNSNTIDTEISKLAISSTDTTPNFLSSKIQAGANVTFTTLNQGANEVIEISTTGGGAGGNSSSHIWLPGDMSIDNVNSNVTSGTVFSTVESLDFDSANGDGSIYVSTVTGTSWDSAKDNNVEINYVLDGTGSNGQIVKLSVDIFVTSTDNTQSTTPNVTTPQDITLSTTLQVGRYYSLLIPYTSSSLSIGPTDLVNMKVSRLSSDAGDTYGGVFKLINIRIYQ